MVLVAAGGIPVAAQIPKSRFQNPEQNKDTTVRAYHITPPRSASNDPFVLKMGTDSLREGPVKMPNGYRSGLVGPVPMPTYKIGQRPVREVQGLNIQNNNKPKKKKHK